MSSGIEYSKSVRQPFLNASDYIFYIELHIEKERNDYYFEEKLPIRELNPEIPKLPEILNKLVSDLQTAFDSFITEFLENDGVYCLLNLLRLCLNRQQYPGANRLSEALVADSKNKTAKQNKDRHRHLKRALSDEYDCLLSLQLAVKRNSVSLAVVVQTINYLINDLLASTSLQRALQKLIGHKTGLSTLTACIVSNLTKSRLIALQLLTRACDLPEGVTKVLEAMSTMRIIFGESVRFKFLVSMINSATSWSANSIECNALQLLNTLLVKTVNCAEQIRLQCELEEAGLDPDYIERTLIDKNVAKDEVIWNQIQRFRKQYINVNEKINPKNSAFDEKIELKEEVQILQRALFKLEADKINLMSIERQLKEKCEDLEQEVDHLRTKFNVLLPNKKVLGSPTSDNGTGDSGQWTDSDADLSGFRQRSALIKGEKKSDQNKYIYDLNVKNEDEFIYVPAIHPPPNFVRHLQRETPEDSYSDKSSKRNASNNKSGQRDDPLSESLWSRRPLNSSQTHKSNDSIKDGPLVVEVHPKPKANEYQTKYSDTLLGKDRGHSELVLDWNYSLNPQIDTDLSDMTNRNFFALDSHKQKSMSMNRINNLDKRDKPLANKWLDMSDTSITNRFNSIRKSLTKQSKENLSQSNECLQSRDSKRKSTLRTSLQSYFFSGCSTLKYNKKVFHSTDNFDESPKSFPLPKTYKRNFILKGHGNCGLYSGDILKEPNDKNLSDDLKCVPQFDPLSALVHREIADATKDLCQWP